jgi:outer membrane lipoprotein-sorting protein
LRQALLMASLALASLGLPGSARAKAPLELTALEVYEKVLKAQQQQAFLSCIITKEELKGGASAQQVSGTLEVAAGGKANLLITQPSRQLMVSDGHWLYMEMSDVKQVMKYDAEQLKRGGNFFLDLGSSIQHYAKASLKRLIVPGDGFDPKDYEALELMPLDPKGAGFQRMRVWVARDGWVVRQVELKLEGVDTRVRFDSLKIITKADLDKGKAPLDGALFKYSPPKGYEVFDLSSMQQQ